MDHNTLTGAVVWRLTAVWAGFTTVALVVLVAAQNCNAGTPDDAGKSLYAAMKQELMAARRLSLHYQ